MLNERYLTAQVKSDIQKKMVFIGGPRQVGKTTLAFSILGEKNKIGYLNWDADEDRIKILRKTLPNSPIWVFDEIHKYKQWRNYLKGLYDKNKGIHKKAQMILVTGSAKLDYYRYSGDSLQGRYHYLRLHPLSCKELKIQSNKDLKQLLELGGFPEPFFSGSQKEAKRWSREYRSRLLREEITDLEKVSDLGQLELLTLRLPELVGSPLSINSLREDLQVAHKTISRWLDILERLYGIFRITPFGAPRLRAVKKERKHYHFDWTLIDEPGPRFENMIASHLLKWVHFQQDTQGEDLDLQYFRDIDGREVDFVVSKKNKPLFFVECKHSSKIEISKGLNYLTSRFPKIPSWQICMDDSKKGGLDLKHSTGVRICSAHTFLNTLV